MGATEQYLFDISMVVAPTLDLSGNQFYFVEQSAASSDPARSVILPTSSAPTLTLGILQNAPFSDGGGAASVRVLGISKVIAGSTLITAGSGIVSDSDGKAGAAAVLGEIVLGVALDPCTVTGELISVLMNGRSQYNNVTT